ncbi:MAG: hypothetical protein F7C35_04285 [Desulfurococcales archaeon]|nr:hypothetical protein [Desulfurococcales archaeon]
MYDRRIIAFLLIIVLVINSAIILFNKNYIVNSSIERNGEPSSPQSITSEEELLEFITQKININLNNSDDYYLIYLSGRTLKINSTSIPEILGEKPSDVCFLAYVNGKWEIVPFTIVQYMKFKNVKKAFWGSSQTINEDSVIILKMPTYVPKIENPLNNTPPQARGAKKWLWVWVSLPGSKFKYPILYAEKSKNIAEICGSIPYTYSGAPVKGIAKIQLVNTPWPIIWAQEHNISIPFDLFKQIVSIKRGVVSISYNMSWNQPLPDGGGGGGGTLGYVIFSMPIIEPSNENRWIPINITLDSNNPSRTIYLHPFSYNQHDGVKQSNKAWFKIKLTIIPKYNPNDEDVHFSTLYITMYPGTSYSQEKSVDIASVFGAGVPVSISFSTPAQYPYGSHDPNIPFKFEILSGNWTLDIQVTYYLKWENYTEYLPSNKNKVLYKGYFSPISPAPPQAGLSGTIATLVIPAGSSISDANLSTFVFSPISSTAIFSDKNINSSQYYFRVKFGLELPNGFPGGWFIFHPGSLGTCVKNLPAVTDQYMIYYTVTCIFNDIDLNQLSYYFNTDYNLFNITIISYQTVDDNLQIDLKIEDNLFKKINFTSIPIVDVPWSTGFIPTPILNYGEFWYNLSAISLERYNEIQNPILKLAGFKRSSGFNIKSSIFHDGTLFIDISSSGYNYLNSIFGYSNVGKMDSIYLHITINPIRNYEPVCTDTESIRVYGIHEEGTFHQELEKHLNIIKEILSWTNSARKILNYFSYTVNIAYYFIKYKSVDDVQISCNIVDRQTDPKAVYIISAENFGWDPDGFADTLTVYMPEVLFHNQPYAPQCGTIMISGRVSTINIGSFDLAEFGTEEPQYYCKTG